MSTKTVLSTATDVTGTGFGSFLHDKLSLLAPEDRSLVFLKDRNGAFVKGASIVKETDAAGNEVISIVLDFDDSDDG